MTTDTLTSAASAVALGAVRASVRHGVVAVSEAEAAWGTETAETMRAIYRETWETVNARDLVERFGYRFSVGHLLLADLVAQKCAWQDQARKLRQAWAREMLEEGCPRKEVMRTLGVTARTLEKWGLKGVGGRHETTGRAFWRMFSTLDRLTWRGRLVDLPDLDFGLTTPFIKTQTVKTPAQAPFLQHSTEETADA